MSLPWSAAQREWLQAMGFDVLGLATPAAGTPAAGGDATASTPTTVPAALLRAARGVDVTPLLAAMGTPRDVAGRRAFWRALRAVRKAARAP